MKDAPDKSQSLLQRLMGRVFDYGRIELLTLTGCEGSILETGFNNIVWSVYTEDDWREDRADRALKQFK